MDVAKIESKLGFDQIRSLISDRCSTEYASERVERESFSTDPSEIRRRLILTDEMRLIAMFEDSFPTSGYIDCLGFLTPLEKSGTLDVLSLGKLKTMLETLRKIIHFFGSVKDGVYPSLKRMVRPFNSFPEVHRRIDLILDRNGAVKDTASDTLYAIRRERAEKEASVSSRMQILLRKAQQDGLTDSGASVVVRDGKMLLPVNSSKKRAMPGFVYDESATGKTTFIEPAEIVEITNAISELHFAETREIARILYEFSEFVRPYVPDLIKAATLIGEMDFLMAKAQVALDFRAGMPVISDCGEMSLRKARHPLLEKALVREGREIVPLTVTLTPEKRILLISGPNAGGKSVCLKTAGLLQYMFQWGMLIPTSESSELRVFDALMVSLGDDQSIENDLSTYSSFLADMKEMLSDADGNTLVLIDEFGSGTDPAAGGAIAEAILSELDAKGVYGVITTHYTNLKLYASGAKTGVVNGAMLFDAARIAPLFQLEIGLPGNSFAFELARKMGLPEKTVKDAEDRAGKEFVDIERNLRKIVRSRRAIDERLQKIKAADKTLDSITDKYQRELQDIKKTRKDILDEAHRQAQDIIKGANRQVENTIRTIRESGAEKAATQDARRQLQGFLGALEQKKEEEEKTRENYLEEKIRKVERQQQRSHIRRGAPVQEEDKMSAFRSAPLSVGEKVRIKDSGMVGEVTKVSTKAVTVIVGNITTKIPHDRVERVTSNEYKAALKQVEKPSVRRVDPALERRRLEFRPEIDVRGERVMEAVEQVMHFIDDAIMLNMNSVRILHGKGTGALREEIQKYVRTVPGVVSVADEQIQFGGSGVTVVKLG